MVIRDQDGVDEVRLRIGKPPRERDEIVKEYWLIFRDVRGVRLEIDLLTKRACSHAIDSERHSTVEEEPAFVDELDQKFWFSVSSKVPSREHLKRFQIWLCPVSGSIELLAETASLVEAQS